MSDHTLRFPCPSCQTALTVPAAMAGVRGPCPICSAEIQAPQVPEPAPPPTATHAPPPVEEARQEPQPEPKPEVPRLPPEPRAVPGERAKKGIPARPLEEYRRAPETASGRSTRPSQSGGGGNLLLRIGIPVLLLLASGAVVFFIMKARGEEDAAPRAMPSAALSEVEEIAPRLPEQPKPAPAAPAPPEKEPVPVSAVQAAQRVAVSFLQATSLESRMEMIEPALDPAQLKGTIAAGPMPEMTAIKELPQRRDLIEQYIDFPFLVAFAKGAEVERMLLMVRQREHQPPKVLVQPVIDLLGGRLAEFAAAPTGDGSAVEFRAVIEPMPRVFEEGVPNPDDKFTYKLLSADGGTEIARAYASVHSKLAEQLYSFSSNLRWGKRLCATLLLTWNTTEDPDQPYIWVADIKNLNWSP